MQKYENLFQKPLLAVISFMPDRLSNRNEHTQHPRNQEGQRRAMHRIVSTAAASAWLPHAKPCDTGMTGEQGKSSVCQYGYRSYTLTTGQEQIRLLLVIGKRACAGATV